MVEGGRGSKSQKNVPTSFMIGSFLKLDWYDVRTDGLLQGNLLIGIDICTGQVWFNLWYKGVKGPFNNKLSTSDFDLLTVLLSIPPNELPWLLLVLDPFFPPFSLLSLGCPSFKDLEIVKLMKKFFDEMILDLRNIKLVKLVENHCCSTLSSMYRTQIKIWH